MTLKILSLNATAVTDEGLKDLENLKHLRELSLIGNNLGNKLRAGYCANSDFQNTTVLTGLAQRSGTVTNLPGDKIDDVACSVEPGRAVFLKLTVRPLSWMK